MVLAPISDAYIQNLKTGGDLICFDADPLALQHRKDSRTLCSCGKFLFKTSICIHL